MNKRKIKRLSLFAASLLFAAVFMLVMLLRAEPIPPVSEVQETVTYTNYVQNSETGRFEPHKKDYTVGVDLAAVRINNLGELSTLTKVNYTPDEFVKPNTISENSVIVDLTDENFRFARTGTLQFIVFNLNPDSENFDEYSKQLNQFKIGDYWHFTLALPPILSSCNIYQKTQLTSRCGEIEDYIFSDFNMNYDVVSEKHVSHTENTYLDLTFYPKRETMEMTFNSAQIITVHYQSEAGLAGINELPMIGNEKAIKEANKTQSDLLVSASVITALTLAIFLFLCALKRTFSFVPQLLISTGVFFALLSGMKLQGITDTPVFFTALQQSALAFAITAAVLAVSKNVKKLPLKIILTALGVVGIVLSFIVPYVGPQAVSTLTVLAAVIKAVCAAAVIGFCFIRAFNQEDEILSIVNPLIIAVAAIASVFANAAFPVTLNPFFWLYCCMSVVTFIISFKLFFNLEQSNRYLTKNLQFEVERQTSDLQAVITERDNILQYVSHDLQKPLISANHFIDTAIERENDAEQTKTLHIIKQKSKEVLDSLSDVSKLAKFNYIGEASQTVAISKVLKKVWENLSPDCIANGIVMKIQGEDRFSAFAKPKGLENTLFNLIINAVEHAECTEITLSAANQKNRIVISVTDNGKGITNDIDIFKPYVSEEKESTGLGLYICKAIVESMNGELSYTSSNGKTTFTVSLLKA